MVMFRNLDVGQLRTLVTILETGGFRRAAERLSLTQPAVSQHIRRLESLLDGPVFTSTGRRLRLSPQAEELAGYARRMVALNDEAVARVSTVPRREVVLSVGISQQFEPAMPELLSGLTRLLPEARIALRTGLSAPLTARVADGELDLALISAPPRGSRDRFLGRIQLAWFGRHLVDAGAPLPLVLCAEPCNLRVHVLNSITLGRLPWRSVYEGPDLPGVRAAIRAGLGNTCLPANADELWGLRKAPAECFPPVDPVPVSLVVAPGTKEGVIELAHLVARDALRCFPYLDEGVCDDPYDLVPEPEPIHPLAS